MNLKASLAIFFIVIICGCEPDKEKTTVVNQPATNEPAVINTPETAPASEADKKEIDFAEVDHLVALLGDEKTRKDAEAKLLEIGNRSFRHKEKLGFYLQKLADRSDQAPGTRQALSTIVSKCAIFEFVKVPSCGCVGMIDNYIDLRHAFSSPYSSQWSTAKLCNIDFDNQCVITLSQKCNSMGYKFVVDSAYRDFRQGRVFINISLTLPHNCMLMPAVGFTHGTFISELTTMPTSIDIFQDNADITGKNPHTNPEIKSLLQKDLVNDRQSVDELKASLTHANHFVRREAVKALARKNTPEAISAVTKHIQTEQNGLVLRWAAISLGRLKTKATLPALKSLLKRSDLKHNEWWAYLSDTLWAIAKIDANILAEGRQFDAKIEQVWRGYANIDNPADRIKFIEENAAQHENTYLQDTPDTVHWDIEAYLDYLDKDKAAIEKMGKKQREGIWNYLMERRFIIQYEEYIKDERNDHDKDFLPTHKQIEISERIEEWIARLEPKQ